MNCLLCSQVKVPFELVLNFADTQFVVVEDSTSLDTNAVILKVIITLIACKVSISQINEKLIQYNPTIFDQKVSQDK